MEWPDVKSARIERNLRTAGRCIGGAMLAFALVRMPEQTMLAMSSHGVDGITDPNTALALRSAGVAAIGALFMERATNSEMLGEVAQTLGNDSRYRAD